MERPLISVLHPTRRIAPSEAFPQAWRAAHDAYLANCDDPKRVEYVISVHTSRYDEFIHSELLESCNKYAWADFIVIRNVDRDCAVDQVNTAARAASGRMLTGAQDDLFPPDHWDSMALHSVVLKPLPRPELWDWANFPMQPSEDDFRGEWVIRCSSGSPRDASLTMAGFMSRSRYERLGYILSPEFESMFADDYFDWELRRDEKLGLVTVIERQDIQFEHRHPVFGKGTADEAYAQQNNARAYRQGYATFRKLTEGARVISVLMPGETFSHRWVFGMFDVLETLSQRGFIVERFGAHTSNVYATRIELADAAVNLGVKADFILSVDDDNVLNPEQVGMLIADLDNHPELDIVCGWCWCDTGDYENNAFRMSCGRQGPNLECLFFGVEDYCKMTAAGKLSITSDDVAPDAFWSGFPVVLMRGSVLQKLGWEAFRPMLGNYHRGFTSEDTTFFYRAHQAGIKSAVDLRVKVPHLKLRAIEPQILPAADRDKVLEFMKSVNEQLPVQQAAD